MGYVIHLGENAISAHKSKLCDRLYSIRMTSTLNCKSFIRRAD